MTGFQLKDTMTECSTFNEIKQALKKQFSSKTMELITTEKQEETEDEKKERMGFPSIDPKQLLKECGLGEAVPKYDENKITVPVFWQMKEDKFESVFDIKLFGEKKLLAHRMEELLTSHEQKFKEDEE